MIQILRILYHGLPGSPYHCTIATMPIMDSVWDSVRNPKGFCKGISKGSEQSFGRAHDTLHVLNRIARYVCELKRIVTICTQFCKDYVRIL